jgi:hypothetical protein
MTGRFIVVSAIRSPVIVVLYYSLKPLKIDLSIPSGHLLFFYLSYNIGWEGKLNCYITIQ